MWNYHRHEANLKNILTARKSMFSITKVEIKPSCSSGAPGLDAELERLGKDCRNKTEENTHRFDKCRNVYILDTKNNLLVDSNGLKREISVAIAASFIVIIIRFQ